MEVVSLLHVKDLSVSFDSLDVLKKIDLDLLPGEVLALTGPNGCGKTTLLRAITGEIAPSGGSVQIERGYWPVYVRQEDVDYRGSTGNYLLGARPELLKLHEKLEAAADPLAHAEYINEYHAIGGFDFEEEIVLTLVDFGFERDEIHKGFDEHSQGQKRLLSIMRALLSRSKLLLLDEPTNHLDIESLQWLENYLDSYSGSVMVISHDRTFLDNVTNRTIEIMLGRIHDYKAGYSHYLELRRERIEQQTAAYENQQKVIEKTEDFIARFRYKPTKSNQVQSRIKQLEKMERIVVDQEDNSILHINFPPVIRSGQIAFSCSGLSVRYDKEPIFTKAEMVVERGEKVAFVGRNGEGKTTMMKLITGQLLPCEGKLSLGYNVNLGYYAQNQDELLDKEATVYDTLDKIAVGDVRTKLRDILAAFLFRGEEVDKKTEVLSGGERSRLAMAKLMLQPYNMLALDEPTNHMDIRSKEVMKEALMRYEGTLIIVSHDRTFLDGLVDKIYEFRDGAVKEHLGGIRDFLQRRKLENLRELETRAPEKKEANGKAEEKKAPGLSYQEKKERDKILRKLQQTVTRWENRIEQHEQGLALMDKQLASPPAEGFTTAFYQVYEKEKKALEEAFGNWEQAQTELDRFNKE